MTGLNTCTPLRARRRSVFSPNGYRLIRERLCTTLGMGVRVRRKVPCSSGTYPTTEFVLKSIDDALNSTTLQPSSLAAAAYKSTRSNTGRPRSAFKRTRRSKSTPRKSSKRQHLPGQHVLHLYGIPTHFEPVPGD